MSRYTGPVCRLCRREGMKLFLKGDRCLSEKCSFDKRPTPPGMHINTRTKTSEYGLRLREKQKMKRFYGLIGERQFRRYVELAEKMGGVTGDNLYFLLERRLDNVLYRSGFASSRQEARQMISHGHFNVNSRRVSIPSYSVKPGDVISVRENSKGLFSPEYVEVIKERTPAPWIYVDYDKLEIKFDRLPQREELDVPIRENLIIEFYSR
ncbi:ribosomal protein S4 [Thermodesulfobium narugense DSM 14796]|uniref:Small ribosomal subunit protein uS4 n=1 Tax=Thermodesulfobium narugense DSM 14796 TaxID=747365 RepID=M1E7W4_9BACT|nr:30S ribosomal protein S4 [Thermodesulfobium narugense]AEE14169.1 ribosomal protein S4 [Thermodesulfobium narugense DSM 14796]